MSSALTRRSRLLGIRGRTALGAVAVVGVALVVGAGIMVLAQRRALTHNVETAALLRADDLVASLSEGSLPQDIVAQQPDDSLVQVLDDSRGVVGSTTNIAGQAAISTLVAPARGHAATTAQALPDDESEFRVVAVRATAANSQYTVYVAKSLDPVDDSVENLVLLLALGIPPMLLVVGAVTWMFTGRTLGPVEAIRTEVETISTRELHRRVPESKVHDEIGLLARTMNAMLERLETATVREQRFVSDASHELRSPLAAIRAQLEVDLAHPERADWRHSHREALAEVARMQRLVDDLLVLARSDHDVLMRHDHTVDLDDLVLEECRRARSYSDVVVDSSAVSGGQVRGDAELLTRVLRNVLVNAVRHATTLVRVGLGEQGALVVLTVTDDGPGIAAEHRELIFERFARADTARARADGGTGLGLAITREIVAAHQGRIWVQDGQPGAQFVVAFPAA
jgi:signal transduction histidine kinase